MPTSSNNRLIAKNATMLYIRLFISVAISFYTSRVVLQALGVSDYGVYNVVGGIVVLVNMLSSALNGATQRFLTYSLGENNFDTLRTTFSTALLIHLGLSILFIVLAETVGLWLVNTQLVIPEGRMVAANWVYQSAIISTVLGITQVPYNALITSHEHFGIFAVIEILNSCLRLCIAFIVLYSAVDHLKLYSVLYACVAIAIMLFYRYYCVRHFPESHFQKHFDKFLFKDMLGFSGWNLFGNTTLTISQQGISIIINRFFGTVINAANGIGVQIQAVLYAFIGNITTAFSPQIIKEYASKNYSRVNELIFIGTKFASTCILLISIPVLVKMDFLINLWLSEVPTGTVIICQILIVANYFNSFNPLIGTVIIASGRIKYMNICSGWYYLASLVFIYVIIYITHSYVNAYIFSALTPIVSCGIYLYLLKSYLPDFSIMSYLLKIVLPNVLIGLLSLFLAIYASRFFANGVTSLLVVVVASTLSIILLSFFIVFNSSERNYIISWIKNKLKIRFN